MTEADRLARLTAPGPKRILALDGGSLRGAITLGYLSAMERILRDRYGPDTLLRDYFDLIGGTSTGSIIAAGLAIGRSTEYLTDQYRALAPKVMGKRRRFWQLYRSLFDHSELEHELREELGDRTLGDPDIPVGLCIVAKRAETRSTWPLINHPNARYYHSNRSIPLATAVRASTAIPLAFAPQRILIDGTPTQWGAFVDGGVSMAANPAFQVYLVATLQGFPFHWQTGAEQLFLASVGTGAGWEQSVTVESVMDRKLWNWGIEVPGLLLDDASTQNQLTLQLLGRSIRPLVIDREIGDLSEDTVGGAEHLSYLRYNAPLNAAALNEHGLAHLVDRLGDLRSGIKPNRIDDLIEIGRVFGAAEVQPDDFPPAFDLATERQ